MIYAWVVLREGTPTGPDSRGEPVYTRLYASEAEALDAAKRSARGEHGSNTCIFKLVQTHLVKPPACPVEEVEESCPF